MKCITVKECVAGEMFMEECIDEDKFVKKCVAGVYVCGGMYCWQIYL